MDRGSCPPPIWEKKIFLGKHRVIFGQLIYAKSVNLWIVRVVISIAVVPSIAILCSIVIVEEIFGQKYLALPQS